jgi:hypothetical protein
MARKSLSSAVQYTDLSEDEHLEQNLETNGPHLRRSMRRKKKPFSSDYEFDVDLHDKPTFGKHWSSLIIVILCNSNQYYICGLLSF